MELVFIRIKESIYSDQAEQFVELFAKQSNLKLTKFNDIEQIPEKYNYLKAYPVLFFVDNNEIVGHVKGFGNKETQLAVYETELKLIQNPELRPKIDEVK